MAADGGQGIVLFDQRQRVAVAALGGELEIALHGDVGRARGLAGGGAGVVAVDAVVVAVVPVPVLFRPEVVARQRVLGIGLRRAVLFAQLLAQLHGAGGAVFHAAAAGHAVFGVHVRHVGRAAHVRRVEELGGAQRVAHVHVAVADGKDLVLAVDVGDLVDKAVLLALLKDGQGLFLGDVAAALVGLHHVVGHVAHGNAPALLVVGAALVIGLAAAAAGAGACGVFALILFQPVGDVLNGDRLVLHADGLLHGDHVHADARAAGRDHLGDLLQGQPGHIVEEHAKLRVLLHQIRVHVGEFAAARHEHGHKILLLMGGVFPVVLQNTGPGHALELGFKLFFGNAGALCHLRQGSGDADAAEFQGDLGLLVRDHQGQRPVFRVGAFDLLQPQLLGNAVGNHFAQLCDRLAEGALHHRRRIKALCSFGHFFLFHSCTSLCDRIRRSPCQGCPLRPLYHIFSAFAIVDCKAAPRTSAWQRRL